MSGNDGKEIGEYDAVGVLSPTLTADEKTDEEVYKEAFDHFDGNHSKTIPTSVSSKLEFLKTNMVDIHFKFILSPEPNLRAKKGWAKSNRGGDSRYDQPGVIIHFIMPL